MDAGSEFLEVLLVLFVRLVTVRGEFFKGSLDQIEAADKSYTVASRDLGALGADVAYRHRGPIRRISSRHEMDVGRESKEGGTLPRLILRRRVIPLRAFIEKLGNLMRVLPISRVK